MKEPKTEDLLPFDLIFRKDLREREERKKEGHGMDSSQLR